MPVLTDVEPTPKEIDDVIRDLEKSWTSAITIRRQSGEDVGYREIILSLDGMPVAVLQHGEAITLETAPGRHRLRAHNTLFGKTVEFTLAVGEHASFVAANRAGWGTYSGFAFVLGFLGAGPLYVTLEQEDAAASGS